MAQWDHSLGDAVDVVAAIKDSAADRPATGTAPDVAGLLSDIFSAEYRSKLLVPGPPGLEIAGGYSELEKVISRSIYGIPQPVTREDQIATRLIERHAKLLRLGSLYKQRKAPR